MYMACQLTALVDMEPCHVPKIRYPYNKIMLMGLMKEEGWPDQVLEESQRPRTAMRSIDHQVGHPGRYLRASSKFGLGQVF